MKLLIVDDKAAVRSEMKRILTELKFNDITQAVDGNEAWFKLKAEFEGEIRDRYDLVISDMEMPEMSGLELLEAIRKDKELKDLPFIMVTAVNTKEVILKTMKLGIKGYIIKPFTFDTVRAKLAQAGYVK